MTTTRNFSFSGGEIAPALYSRVDQTKYQTGARTLKNVFVPRSGGAFNRPGTSFVGEIPASTDALRFIPFIFDEDDTYVLEFGELYMRVIKNGGYITDSARTDVLDAVLRGTTTRLQCTSNSFTDGDIVSISGVVGTTDLNGRDFLVANRTGATFEIQTLGGNAIDSSAYDAYVSGGTVRPHVKVTTTYTEAQLPKLQYSQSADVMYLACEGVIPRVLSRTDDDSWAIADFAISQEQEPPTNPTTDKAAGSTYLYTIHSVGADGEISDSVSVGTSVAATSGAGVTVSFTASPTASYYMVLKNYCYIGATATGTFLDINPTPEWCDGLGNSPLSGTSFASYPYGFPGAVGLFQQRLLFGNVYDTFLTLNFPDRVVLSFVGHQTNFDSIGPFQDNHPFSFSIAGRRQQVIRHLIDLERLVILTSAGVYIAQGDEAGGLIPTAINLKQIAYNGSAILRPLFASESLIYLEARGSIVRDLNFQVTTDGYKGNDLTTFATHLFDGFTISDWDYQTAPDSMIFAARNDGVMLGCTYVKEQQILGWHRHTFSSADADGAPLENGGLVENVVCIPEGDRDVLYFTVRRQNLAYDEATDSGRSKLYTERMVIEPVSDVRDMLYMDSALTYDGRSDGEGGMTLSGSGWTHNDTLTLTSEDPDVFTSADVGNVIQIPNSATGTMIRFTVTGYTSPTIVTGKPHMTIPAAMRNVAIYDWARAVDEVTGLWHLEGYQVSVLGDGYVVASPNNPAYETITVANGRITLPTHYAVIQVGLPYVSDVETLDIDTANGETLVDKKKLIGRVNLFVQDSRGIWVGNRNADRGATSLDGLDELKIRNSEDYESPVALATGVVEVNIQPEWNSNGGIMIRQVDPLPMNILSVAPSGYIPFKG